ncbi:MAG: CBS domain-containing protein, partial [Candidatus Jordarchaeales archaeon]
MFYLPSPEDLKQARKRLGITQEELARMAGVSQSLIARIESGSVDPRLSTLRKIVNALSAFEKNKICARDIMFSPVISVSSDETVRTAISLMEKNSISQLPVIDKGRLVGSISESTIMKYLSEGKDVFDKTVGEIMEESFPTVNPLTSIEVVHHLIVSGNPAVLVVDKGEVVGIITKIDLISAYKK